MEENQNQNDQNWRQPKWKTNDWSWLPGPTLWVPHALMLNVFHKMYRPLQSYACNWFRQFACATHGGLHKRIWAIVNIYFSSFFFLHALLFTHFGAPRKPPYFEWVFLPHSGLWEKPKWVMGRSGHDFASNTPTHHPPDRLDFFGTQILFQDLNFNPNPTPTQTPTLTQPNL